MTSSDQRLLRLRGNCRSSGRNIGIRGRGVSGKARDGAAPVVPGKEREAVAPSIEPLAAAEEYSPCLPVQIRLVFGSSCIGTGDMGKRVDAGWLLAKKQR